MAKAGRPQQDAARRLERAHRILDAAAGLIMRWGYDKTTIEDVAKAAGVAKGTIYLHWKTRDALFGALLRRDRVLMLEEVRAGGPATLGELFGLLAGALQRRPLTKAGLLGDSEVLGKLTREKRDREGAVPFGGPFERYLAVLREQGALRADRTPAEHLTVLGSTLYGFLILQGYLPDALRSSDERLSELIADAAVRATEPGRPLRPGGAEAVSSATAEYLDAAVDIARDKLRKSLGTKENVT